MDCTEAIRVCQDLCPLNQYVFHTTSHPSFGAPPAALVVLLSAIALQRVGFGLLLIVAFSVGLAGVRITPGLLMVSARHVITRLQGEGRLMTRWLPLTSAAVITVFGLAMIVQALMTAGMMQIRL